MDPLYCVLEVVQYLLNRHSHPIKENSMSGATLPIPLTKQIQENRKCKQCC